MDTKDEESYGFPEDLSHAIHKICPSDDPLDHPGFNQVDYINKLFPNEQSLTSIDDIIINVRSRIANIDEDIRGSLHHQNQFAKDGHEALKESQRAIQELCGKIRVIKSLAEQSENNVCEITRDIKQLDCAKKNLTSAITTLNHLHMFIDGIENLQHFAKKRQYYEAANLIEGISNVVLHLQTFKEIPHIQGFVIQFNTVQDSLGKQILADFKETLENPSRNAPSMNQLGQSCKVLDVVRSSYREELINYIVNLQLAEYKHLYQPSEDAAWLDRVDNRYTWLKKHLIEFENKLGRIFPPDWALSERISLRFCAITREDLTAVMRRRSKDIEAQLLIAAIQKTVQFESLLMKRFEGFTNKGLESQVKPVNPFEEEEGRPESAEDLSPFLCAISSCFESYLYIVVETQDRHLSELMEKFVAEHKALAARPELIEYSPVLQSCSDLFHFYKKALVQCTQLSKNEPIVLLGTVFQKYLREYAMKVLQANLPKFGSSFMSIPLTTTGFIQNFQIMLKEGDVSKLTKEEITRACSILTTAEYCLETSHQLEEKLKEKMDPKVAEKLSFSAEMDAFGSIISNCIQILVQDMESSVEPALQAMAKTNWAGIEAVGDTSAYVTAIIGHFRQKIPPIRDGLATSRKYFAQFCAKFATTFTSKFMNSVFKCKPISTAGAEQLLLDTHTLKTTLLDLPSVGSDINRKAPASYTKLVIKNMTRIEMILKLVLSPNDRPENFVASYQNFLPDSDVSELQKVLDMKGIKKSEQSTFLDVLKLVDSRTIGSDTDEGSNPNPGTDMLNRLINVSKSSMDSSTNKTKGFDGIPKIQYFIQTIGSCLRQIQSSQG